MCRQWHIDGFLKGSWSPWWAWRRPAAHLIDVNGLALDKIETTPEVARSLSPRECFGDLACDPFRSWIGCDVDPDKVSASQPNDDEDIEQIEANGRNNEKVHGGDVGCVVTQEDAPALGRRSTSLAHVLRDARLSDLEAELEQLAMDARRTPQRIFRAHL